jgi:hypothetical protein
MGKPALTRNRIIAAYVIAVIADILEFPITATEDISGGLLLLPAEAADGVLDCIVMAAMTKLLGFHWVFLPGFLIELVPEVDLLPTWVGCVALVVWKRRKEEAAAPSPPALDAIDVTPRAEKGPPLLGSSTRPPLVAADGGNPTDDRLQKLTALREQNLISEAEYDLKRQKILSDL